MVEAVADRREQALASVGADVTKRALVVETGTCDNIEAFEGLVRPFGLIEMARTGEIAISRGRGET